MKKENGLPATRAQNASWTNLENASSASATDTTRPAPGATPPSNSSSTKKSCSGDTPIYCSHTGSIPTRWSPSEWATRKWAYGDRSNRRADNGILRRSCGASLTTRPWRSASRAASSKSRVSDVPRLRRMVPNTRNLFQVLGRFLVL